MTGDTTRQIANYPIVESRELHEPPKRGFLGLGGRERDGAEVPRPHEGHHVLVWKVDGNYLLDNVSLLGRDDYVVRATHVSVVDMGRDVPVAVQFDIASADSSLFTVEVTFQCTVVDPERVVREGITDPAARLLTYLKTHRNASQMGLRFALSDVNEARRYVNAQLIAYSTLSPPVIGGFEVSLSSVELRTPQEVAEFSQARRDRRNRHVLEAEDMTYRAEFELERAEREHLKALADQQNDQDRDFQKRKHDRTAARWEQEEDEERRTRAQQAELFRRGELNSFQRAEIREFLELIGNDPDHALHAALQAGDLDAAQVAKELRASQERARELERLELDKDRNERALREREAHQERMRALEHAMAERMAKLEAKREDSRRERQEAMRAAERERDVEMLRIHWDRQDEVEETNARRKAVQQRLEAHLQLLRDLAQRGHFDTLNLDLERLVAQLGGIAAAIDVDEPAQLGADTSGSDAGAGTGTDSRSASPDDVEPDANLDGDSGPDS